MMGFLVIYMTPTGRRRNLLVLAKSFEDAKKISESHLGDSQKIVTIKYIPPKK